MSRCCGECGSLTSTILLALGLSRQQKHEQQAHVGVCLHNSPALGKENI